MVNEANRFDYDEGFLIGTSGTDGGLIVRAEEHRFGAGMTIEEEGNFAPFSITCTIYGWKARAGFFPTETEAEEEFDRMKIDLEKISSLVPEDLEADEETMDAISDEIEEFVEMYP